MASVSPHVLATSVRGLCTAGASDGQRQTRDLIDLDASAPGDLFGQVASLAGAGDEFIVVALWVEKGSLDCCQAGR